MSTASCACINVRYEPVNHGGGTFSERWRCRECGAWFVRNASLASLRERLAAAEARAKRAEEALLAAAKSLESIKNWDHNDWDDMNVRGYANSRATAARAALAETPVEEGTK